MNIRNKKIVVVGLGKTGVDTALFLKKKGADVSVTEKQNVENVKDNVRLLEKKNIKIETGNHSAKFMEGTDLLVMSPGVAENSLPPDFARKHNIPVISEIELAYRFSPTGKIIAVTGTNGKTTTVTMVGNILKKAGFPCVVCGNIGNTFIGELEELTPETWVVLEVSSFQLEKIIDFRPRISCLLNISDDHLDRYASLDSYAGTKEKIFSNQFSGDWAVLNYDDVYCRQMAGRIASRKAFFSCSGKSSDVFLENNTILADFKGKRKILDVKNLKAEGRGNIKDMMAAVLISLICGVEDKAISQTLYGFLNMEHRYEKVAEIKGIEFINDSKSTNPHSVNNALESIEGKKKVILIMGGKDKGFSFLALKKPVEEKVKLLILLGETKEKIAGDFCPLTVPVIFVDDLNHAVRISLEKSEKGDIVLFSPGCSSFDMFSNYKERGNVFKREVKALL
jgi:UDP-N-acetylmuramoylalanine--D-glutamate ligase